MVSNKLPVSSNTPSEGENLGDQSSIEFENCRVCGERITDEIGHECATEAALEERDRVVAAADAKDKRIAELEAEVKRLEIHQDVLSAALVNCGAERDQLAAKYDAEHEAYMDLFRQLSEYERKELAGELVPAASLETARRALEHFTTHYNDGVIHEAKNALTQLSNPSAALEEACKHCGAVLEEDPCNGGMFCRKCHEEIMALEERHAQAEIPANGLERDRAVRRAAYLESSIKQSRDYLGYGALSQSEIDRTLKEIEEEEYELVEIRREFGLVEA